MSRPPLLAEAFLFGMIAMVSAEVYFFNHAREYRDQLMNKWMHDPPPAYSPGGGGSDPPDEVLVVGMLTAGNLIYHPRL
jgi:hypothetical protein